MKKTTFIIQLLFCLSLASAQGWQYVGTPNINQPQGGNFNVSDLEFSSSGQLYAAYLTGLSSTKTLALSTYSGGSWSSLPSPGTFSNINYIDLEVNGSTCYYAFSRVVANNIYVFVYTYNGTTWTPLADSVLIGNSGSGGLFELLLDNNGIPTLLGASTGITANKKIMQYTGSAWNAVYTISGSTASQFQENNAAYDNQNNLYFSSTGYVITTAVTYFSVVHKLSGTVCTTVGDTLYNGPVVNPRIRLNSSNTPYLCFNAYAPAKVMAYKLVGSTWSFIADTAKSIGTMYAADLTADGKLAFYTLEPTTKRTLHYYDSKNLVTMDTIIPNGTAAAVNDLAVAPGTSDAYIMLVEADANAASNISVMKHTVKEQSTGTIPVYETNSGFAMYPNPAHGHFNMQTYTDVNATVEIFNSIGQCVLRQVFEKAAVLEAALSSGVYIVTLRTNDGSTSSRRLIIE